MPPKRPRPAELAGSRTSSPPAPDVTPVRPGDADSAPFPVIGVGPAGAASLASLVSLLARSTEAPGEAAFLAMGLSGVPAPSGPLPVRQAADGMMLAPGQIYCVPPGMGATVQGSTLRLAPAPGNLPFDLLLTSLARACGPRGIGILLAGPSADGRLGAHALKKAGGWVIAEEPEESTAGALPGGGAADFVLPLAEIPGALSECSRRMGLMPGRPAPGSVPPLDRGGEFAAVCCDHLLRTYAPAAVLADAAGQFLYGVGPVGRYLSLQPGRPSLDLLSLAPPPLRERLETAMRRAALGNETVSAPACRFTRDGQDLRVRVEIQPVEWQGQLLRLVCFIDEPEEATAARSEGLRNVIESTSVAAVALDPDLRIRFFTSEMRALFNLIPADTGRPLGDLAAAATDSTLAADAREVVREGEPLEREIEGLQGGVHIRRIRPYRTEDGIIAGVMVTYSDITERKHAAAAIEEARQQANIANVAKSRFLAVASHDLRQPLQTLALLQGLLAKLVEGERARKLVARLDETLGAISSMLNTLLDINQIDAGTVHADIVTFPMNDVLARLSEEFTYHAQAQGLEFRVVPCRSIVRSDPRLLEQMIRNLLSNAFKFTRQGKVLLGCRRHGATLSVEIWDTGVGIPAEQFATIFGEYRQLEAGGRERGRGLGLGLYIVQRLGKLLGHKIDVRSNVGKGSVFSIGLALPPQERGADSWAAGVEASRTSLRAGTILIVENDPDVRELLETLLSEEGHRVAIATDSSQALHLVARSLKPDVVIADYNLPVGLNGLDLVEKLRGQLNAQVPGIILTGDISTGTLRDISQKRCLRLNKPVRLSELSKAIQKLLPANAAQGGTVPRAQPQPQPEPAVAAGERAVRARVFVVDDDAHVRAAIRSVLEDDGHAVEEFASCEAFLDSFRPVEEACLLVDAYLPGMNGIELLKRLREAGHHLPSIMITGNSDVPIAVEAMKAGASDFIEKPIGRPELLVAIERALEQARDQSKLVAWRESAASHVADLTPRQREIMKMVLAGHPSKNIAADLGISQRTVENHRASIMKKTGSKSLPALARLALAAAWNVPDEPLN